MTNILVPTDFQPASLKLAEAAIKSGEYGKCAIVLFHAFALPSSPFDLLGSRTSNPASECVTEEFRQACKSLKDAYPKEISKVVIRCMQGDTRAVFRNFLEANDIDLVYCPDEAILSLPHSRSLNPIPFFAKCGVPLIKAGRKKPVTVLNQPAFATVQFSTQ